MDLHLLLKGLAKIVIAFLFLGLLVTIALSCQKKYVVDSIGDVECDIRKVETVQGMDCILYKSKVYCNFFEFMEGGHVGGGIAE